MKVALVRVGIDSGTGGMQGPLFQDGRFELIPIPDGSQCGPTYGSIAGRYGSRLVDYFPERRRERMQHVSMHVDPEFQTFTYGSPNPAQSGLRHLEASDLLVFYGGLQGWDLPSASTLYLIGYLEVQMAARAADLSDETIRTEFANNAHVRDAERFAAQRDRLVLVKGRQGSRLLQRATPISEVGCTRTGKPQKVLSREMQSIFGRFGGRLSLQRCPARWVEPTFVRRAAELVRSLD